MTDLTLTLLHPISVGGSDLIEFDFIRRRITQGGRTLHREFQTRSGWWRRTWPHPWQFERD